MTSARTTLRRGAGTVTLFSALLLALTSLLLAPAASADETPTCKDVEGFDTNYEDDTSGDWGSISFDQDDGPLLLTVNDGYALELCLKKGTDPVIDGPYVGPLEDHEVHYPGAEEDGFSHYSYRLLEVEPDEADVTLVKVWQDDEGASTDAPANVMWEATLTLDDGDDTTLAVSDSTSDTDTATTDDGTAYTVAEDDSSADFDEVACSAAVQSEIEGTYGDADTIAYGTGNGAVDGETVHVVCNAASAPTPTAVTWDLTVDKTVDGDDGGAGPYSFTVTCDDGTDESLSIADGQSDSVEGISEDAACTVTETDVPEDATVTITTSEDATVVDGPSIDLAARDTAITVFFVNAFEEDETPTTDVDADEVVRPTPDESDDVAVLPNVVEKPAPATPAPAVAVAAQELPATGLSSTQMLLLALLLMGLGAVMILGPEGHREY